jgi:hypothetical protein
VLKEVDKLVLFDEPALPLDHTGQPGSHLLTPEVLTPDQYHPSPPPTPYHLLLLAVLEDAIRCFQRNFRARSGSRRVQFREAKEWLFDTRSGGFMSFPVVCESLGIEATLLRRHLREWQTRTRRGLEVPRLPRRRPISTDKPISHIMFERYSARAGSRVSPGKI